MLYPWTWSIRKLFDSASVNLHRHHVAKPVVSFYARICVGIYHVIMCFISDDRWDLSECDLVNVSANPR